MQQERGFQKQPTIFQNAKRLDGVKKAAIKRYTRTVGLGFKMPAEVRCAVLNTLNLINLRFDCLFLPPLLTQIIIESAWLICVFSLFSFSPYPNSHLCAPTTTTPSLGQVERAFQKQSTIFANRKGGLKKADSRYVQNPGLGFKVPREVDWYHLFCTNKPA